MDIKVSTVTLVYPETKHVVEIRLQTTRVAKVNNSDDILKKANRRKNRNDLILTLLDT